MVALPLAGVFVLIMNPPPDHDPQNDQPPVDLRPEDLLHAIEVWKEVVSRFYRRRDVVWRVWVALWGLPAISLLVRDSRNRLLLSRTPASWVTAGALAFS